MITRRFITARLAGVLVALLAIAAGQGIANAAWDPNKVVAHEAAVSETLVEFSNQDPSLARFFDEAYGYAVFPKVGEVAFIIGGQHGKGELFEQGVSIGTAKITAVSVGASLGGQTFQEIIFFKSKDAVDKFKENAFSFSADATAIIAEKGAGTSAVWSDDIAVFTRGQKGAMIDASVSGQRFKFEPN